MRVLMVGGDDSPGGVARYIRVIADGQPDADLEFHATVSCVREGASFLGESVRRHVMPLGYGLFRLPAKVAALRAIIAKCGIDVVHAHTARAGLLSALAVAGADTPLVYSGHSWRFEQKTNAAARLLFRKVEHFICSRARVATFLTKRDRDLGVALGLVRPDRAVAVNTRLPVQQRGSEDAALLRERFGIPPDVLVVGNVGSLLDIKNPLLFVEVARRIANARTDARFIWVGDGDLRREVEMKAEALGLAQALIVTGYVSSDTVASYRRIMDVLLCTSRIEGVPLNILESQLAGVPVVSARYRGVEEVIRHRESGFIFEQHAPEEGAKFVLEVAVDRAMAEAVAANASRVAVANHAGPETMAREFARIYRTAMEDAEPADRRAIG